MPTGTSDSSSQRRILNPSQAAPAELTARVGVPSALAIPESRHGTVMVWTPAPVARLTVLAVTDPPTVVGLNPSRSPALTSGPMQASLPRPRVLDRGTRSRRFRQLAAVALGAVGLLSLSASQAALATPTRPAASSPVLYPVLDDTLSGILPAGIQESSPPAPARAPTPVAGPFGLSTPATLTASGIPEAAYRAYLAAAAALSRTDPSCGLHWSVIAGIGRVESNHGRFGGASIGADGVVRPAILGIRLDGSRPGTARISDSDGGRYDGDTLTDRAVGPMQFLPGTWKAYGAPGNPQDMDAAALAAGRYLCAGGSTLATQPGRWAAVYRYNHSDSYVSLVLSLADAYASGHVSTFPSRPAGTIVNDTTPAATPPGPPPAVPAPPRPPDPAVPVTRPTTSPIAGDLPLPRPSPASGSSAPPASSPPSAPSDPGTDPTVGTSPVEVPTTTDPAPPPSPEPEAPTSEPAPPEPAPPEPVATTEASATTETGALDAGIP